jgi:hypothetical protein
MQSLALYNSVQMEQIQTSINETYGNGKEGLIGHEIKSEYVHTDVMVLDSGEGDYNFATFGMGARKTNAPIPQLQRTELVMCATGNMALDSREAAIVMGELQRLSKFPFKNDTFFGPYHTIDASELFTETFGFDAFLFADAHITQIDNLGDMLFLWVIPIYKEELHRIMQFNSIDVLDELVITFGTEIHFVDSGRDVSPFCSCTKNTP